MQWIARVALDGNQALVRPLRHEASQSFCLGLYLTDSGWDLDESTRCVIHCRHVGLAGQSASRWLTHGGRYKVRSCQPQPVSHSASPPCERLWLINCATGCVWSEWSGVACLTASVRYRSAEIHSFIRRASNNSTTMREIVHIQAGQCGNQIGSKV